MAIQFSVEVRNAVLDAIETSIGASAILRIRSGAPPANCAAADTGTVLAEATLPADWMSAAAAGAKAKLGTWQDAAANAGGTAGHFRIYTSGGACRIQGTVGTSSADMIVDTVTVTLGQAFTINSFTITAPNP